MVGAANLYNRSRGLAPYLLPLWRDVPLIYEELHCRASHYLTSNDNKVIDKSNNESSCFDIS